MKENLTEIVFILDRSGSMYGLVEDTIGGFNSFIEEQKKEDGEALLTTVLFDNQCEILHDGINLKDVKILTNKEYFTRGMTALLDAIGKTINSVGNRLNKTPEDEKPSKVIFVITTDGYENSSIEFTQKQIKEMIGYQTSKYNWQFIFLGANIDAVNVAESYGIRGQFASKYTADTWGTQSVYTTMSNVVRDYREKGVVLDNWKNNIK
jgi:uncharacterized protein YegL